MQVPNWLFYTIVIIFPLIAGLQRYAVAYGYDGQTKAQAWNSARIASAVVAFIMVILVIAKQFE